MQKALIKVELTNNLFSNSAFKNQFSKKIQTLKPIIVLTTPIQYSHSMNVTKDTKAACKQFTGRFLILTIT